MHEEDVMSGQLLIDRDDSILIVVDAQPAFLVDLSPCLKAGDSWAEHSGPGMLARRQNAVTG